MSKSPQFNLIYYKRIVDACLVKFISDNNDSFVRDGECYVFSKAVSRTKFQQTLKELVDRALHEIACKYDVLNPKYFIVIGSCIPKDNILFFRRDKSFPVKLENLVQNHSDIKYILRENDIVIDLPMLNSAIDNVFDELFKSSKPLGDGYENVFCIKHQSLDCYSMFKTIKWVYGKSSCVNLCKTLDLPDECLVAVNDLVSKNVKNKSSLNSSLRFKKIAVEVRQFLQEKIDAIGREAVHG